MDTVICRIESSRVPGVTVVIHRSLTPKEKFHQQFGTEMAEIMRS